ncbi:uncharacterized protein CLAFUR5_03332 [Fulvia fulva]|uniref:Uncharacterized protein n=1 Tax=Passalora fulva TaxID=5499 RepID=A0A9Q8L9Y0_PASFU
MPSTSLLSSGQRPSESLFVSADEQSDIDNGPDKKRVKRSFDDVDSAETSSVASSDEEDEDDQSATAYDISAEARPRLAFYHESFAKAERDVVRACKVLRVTNEELISGGYKNEEITTVCGKSGLEAINPP